MLAKARFSECKKYRYSLERIWDKNGANILFIGLNPSLASDKRDDPTIRRLTDYGMNWGFGKMVVVNLFSLISPFPRDLLKHSKPIGKRTDEFIIKESKIADSTVVMWGNKGNFFDRANRVLSLLNDPLCFGKNKSGMPSHPLYLPKKIIPSTYIFEKETTHS